MKTTDKPSRKESAKNKRRATTDLKASKNTKKTKGGRRKAGGLKVAHPDAAGIDIGAQSHYVAVPEGRDEQSVRCFSAYTTGLAQMVQWLQACRITTVAMESTGVYWIAAYQALEDAGFEVLLVDARSVKHVPGRKTDLKDCQWLQQLHTCGLLRAAFRPAEEVCRLRTLNRHRKSLVESAAMHIQHIQKALNEMNLHLHHVLSDITGESGLRMLDAILGGERDPQALAALADRRVKKSAAEIAAALTGNYREEQILVMSQALATWRHHQQQIECCDQAILAQLQKMHPGGGSEPAAAASGGVESQAKKNKPKARCAKTGQEAGLAAHLARILGVDLTMIPGLGILAVLTILSEIGVDMSKWRNEKAFASWLGLCPNHKISGGRVLSARSRHVVSRLATILRMAAMVIGKTDTALGSFYRRKRAQLGAPKANTATARKLACLIYRLIKNGQSYQAPDVQSYELKFKKQIVASLHRRAETLGYKLVEIPIAA